MINQHVIIYIRQVYTHRHETFTTVTTSCTKRNGTDRNFDATHILRSMMGLVGLGSTSDYLIHHLHCPVLVVRNIPASGDRILEALSTATEAADATTAAVTAPTPATTLATTVSDETSDETAH
jgi:hypothetical protein